MLWSYLKPDATHHSPKSKNTNIFREAQSIGWLHLAKVEVKYSLWLFCISILEIQKSKSLFQPARVTSVETYQVSLILRATQQLQHMQ